MMGLVLSSPWSKGRKRPVLSPPPGSPLISPTFSKRKRPLVFHDGLWQLPAVCSSIPGSG